MGGSPGGLEDWARREEDLILAAVVGVLGRPRAHVPRGVGHAAGAAAALSGHEQRRRSLEPESARSEMEFITLQTATRLPGGVSIRAFLARQKGRYFVLPWSGSYIFAVQEPGNIVCKSFLGIA